MNEEILQLLMSLITGVGGGMSGGREASVGGELEAMGFTPDMLAELMPFAMAGGDEAEAPYGFREPTYTVIPNMDQYQSERERAYQRMGTVPGVAEMDRDRLQQWEEGRYRQFSSISPVEIYDPITPVVTQKEDHLGLVLSLLR